MLGNQSIGYKQYTLLIPFENDRVLLGKKKRGFGEGYYNGFGGKIEQGERTEQAACRELFEEAGIQAVAYEQVGRLHFSFDDKPLPWEVHVFSCKAFKGEPRETDEMKPEWFNVEDIPYSKMWADDVHWYPLFLAGKKFEGKFCFKDTHTLVKFELDEIKT